MFTQSCFIKSFSMEIIDKLKNLGMSHKQCIVSKYIPYIFVNGGFYSTNDFGTDEEIEDAIDCGTNEDLFLAIAALRDDTDKNQWFVYDNTDYADEQEKEIAYFICKQDSIKDEMCINSMYADCHKATIQELIEYFKDK